VVVVVKSSSNTAAKTSAVPYIEVIALKGMTVFYECFFIFSSLSSGERRKYMTSKNTQLY
jgi:hypothetical protein